MLSNTIIGFIRTAVPVAVAAALTWLATTLGITEPLPDIGPFAVAVVLAVYWLGVEALAKRWPKLGWLLGYPKSPEYLPTHERNLR